MRPIASGQRQSPAAHLGVREHQGDVKRIAALISCVLAELGVDQSDENLLDTPERVARSMVEQLWGYTQEPRSHLATDFDANHGGGVVIQSGIDVQSMCAHHMLPFGGTATVAYVPSGSRVVGLSKLTRLVYAYSARLQLQERLTWQVADALNECLNPTSVMVVVTAAHDCMRLRGVKSPASQTTTVARTGTWNDADVALINSLHTS